MQPRHFIPIALAFAVIAAPIAVTSSARASAPPHQAAPPVTTHTIDIEVTDTEKGHPPRVARFTLSVEGGEWTRLQTQADTETYKLGVRLENDRVRLDINRSDSAGSSASLNANIVANVALNKRTVVGRVQRQNGTATEIAVVVH